jgi:hypothetical protein
MMRISSHLKKYNKNRLILILFLIAIIIILIFSYYYSRYKEKQINIAKQSTIICFDYLIKGDYDSAIKSCFMNEGDSGDIIRYNFYLNFLNNEDKEKGKVKEVIDINYDKANIIHFPVISFIIRVEREKGIFDYTFSMCKDNKGIYTFCGWEI